MKFRYYITDLFDGAIRGTNDERTAREHAQCEGCFVLDAETGKWMHMDGTDQDVKEVTV